MVFVFKQFLLYNLYTYLGGALPVKHSFGIGNTSVGKG